MPDFGRAVDLMFHVEQFGVLHVREIVVLGPSLRTFHVEHCHKFDLEIKRAKVRSLRTKCVQGCGSGGSLFDCARWRVKQTVKLSIRGLRLCKGAATSRI